MRRRPDSQLTIAPFKRADIEALPRIQPDGWGDISEPFRFYLNFKCGFPIKAINESDGMIGTGAAIHFANSAWLAHIIVDLAHRGKGIGGAIVENLLEHIDRKGIETSLLLATELGKPVYRKHGFEDVGNYSFLIRTSEATPCLISGHIRKATSDDFEAVFRLDGFICGEDRRPLIKHAFHDGLVYQENGESIQGFYLPSLKEGPIYATTQEAGFALMDLKYNVINRASLPSENVAAIEHLQSKGFEIIEQTGARMIRGAKIPWQPTMIYSRIGGNLG